MRRAAVIAALAVVGGGCRGQTSEEPPIQILRNMFITERYNPQARSSFFADHRTMRPHIEGTVSRDYIDDEALTTGREPDGAGYVLTIPPAAVTHFGGMAPMLERGRERFNIYCSVCHSQTGDGRGIIVRRATVTGYNFPEPPTFHQDRLRHAPDGQIYASIANGVRNMPSYAAQIPVYDRWAIVAYFRALQLSQAAPTTEPAR